MLHASLQNHAIVNRGNGDVRGADIDNESGGFARSKTAKDDKAVLAERLSFNKYPGYLRCKHATSREVEGRSAPFLHCNLNGLLASLDRVPARLGHQQWTVGERFLIRLQLHFCRKLVIWNVVQAIVKRIARFRASESRGEGVLPHLLCHIPIFDNAILTDWVMDG